MNNGKEIFSLMAVAVLCLFLALTILAKYIEEMNPIKVIDREVTREPEKVRYLMDIHTEEHFYYTDSGGLRPYKRRTWDEKEASIKK